MSGTLMMAPLEISCKLLRWRLTVDSMYDVTSLDHSAESSIQKHVSVWRLQPDVKMVPITRCTRLEAPLLEHGISDAEKSEQNDQVRIVTRFKQIDTQLSYCGVEKCFFRSC